MKKWLTGTVIRGDGRGRSLGFPTANISLEKPEERPSEGIYAVWARLLSDKHIYQAVAHIGPRPTFVGSSVTVEVHILDFPDRDLYGQVVVFEPIIRLRDILRFNSLEELKEAIKRDCEEAKDILTPSFLNDKVDKV